MPIPPVTPHHIGGSRLRRSGRGAGLGRLSEPAAQFLVPATVVPMTPQIWCVVGYHHEVKGSREDRGVAAGTDVGLAGGVGLHRRHRYPRIAHASKTTTTRTVTMTRAMSSGDLRAGRKGLNPIGWGP